MSWIKGGLQLEHPYYGIVESYKGFFCQYLGFKISHVFCEFNGFADVLTNMSYDYSLGWHVFEKVPKDVKHLVSLDCMEKVSSRDIFV